MSHFLGTSGYSQFGTLGGGQSISHLLSMLSPHKVRKRNRREDEDLSDQRRGDWAGMGSKMVGDFESQGFEVNFGGDTRI